MAHRFAWTRRDALKLGGASLAAVPAWRLGSLPAFAQEDAALRFAWWGSQERHERTYEAIALYQERNPGVTISPEVADFDGHFEKLAVQTAGGQAPDVLQMSPQFILEYAARGALLDLNAYIPDPIDLATWNPETRDLGLIDGVMAGITVGVDSYTLIYNETVFEENGLEWPAEMTWDDFAAFAAEIAETLGEGTYGTEDAGGGYEGFETFLRQRGKLWFSEDGTALGFEPQDLTDWLTFWDGLRQAGAAPPADITAANDNAPENAPVVTGQAPIEWITAGQFVNLQGLTEDALNLHPHPLNPDSDSNGQFIRPALFISAYAQTPAPEAAAEFIQFLLNDPEAAEVLLTARGIPASPEVREILLGLDLGPETKTFDYVDLITETADQVNILTPPGGRGAYDQLQVANQSVAFGEASIEQAVETFFATAPGELGV